MIYALQKSAKRSHNKINLRSTHEDTIKENSTITDIKENLNKAQNLEEEREMTTDKNLKLLI